ncbi:MAG: SbmA/BacA-like family transporter [Candidatus Devosia phytovorans]|uniref:SbmA/BacA-like family transporter n=1 Tax=Candidatus Devosia phytovorans TaxID=3121372 RepID=A0AAJ5VVQ6_9HYPH|nr:SbmA/BacA-like family transporter [Devosia sp.]WEK04412.1 MAG: SbmA/BacA-like family transporter [Devosia sp.]
MSGPGGRIGIIFFIGIVALDFVAIAVSIRLVQWNGDFYGALEAMNGGEAVAQVGVFFIIVAANVSLHLVGLYLRKMLQMRWRRTLTQGALDIWMHNRAYWHLANTDMGVGPNGQPVDNPDQRIAEDCKFFIEKVLSEALDLIGRVAGLFSYIVLLWSLASFPLSLAPVGLSWEIPNYMVWAAFLYVALCSVMVHVLGYPLKGLLVEQQRREANFRFALARLRLNYDEVALSAGEQAERGVFNARFDAIILNWRKLINRELILTCFTFPYSSTVLRIPLFVALPGYLAGHVAFGGLMSLTMAFSNVVTSLSWFVFSYRDLSDLVAASSRLDNFLEAAKAAGRVGRGIELRDAASDVLEVRDLALTSPSGEGLLTIADLSVRHGENVWLCGASGLGKTTLMKTLAGLWPHGTGQVAAPRASMIFLAQRPYFPIGDIHDALAYPRSKNDFSAAELDAVLAKVGLGDAANLEFGRSDTMVGHGLSGGEQQRVMLARLLIHRPQWALLDEPTSALDSAAEAELLGMLRRELADTSFVIVSHREPKGLGRMRIVDLGRSASTKPSPFIQQGLPA